MVTVAGLVPSANGFLHEPGLWYSMRLPAVCPSQGILGPLPILTSGVLPAKASGNDVLAMNAAVMLLHFPRCTEQKLYSQSCDPGPSARLFSPLTPKYASALPQHLCFLPQAISAFAAFASSSPSYISGNSTFKRLRVGIPSRNSFSPLIWPF